MSVAEDIDHDGFRPIGLGHNSRASLAEMLKDQHRDQLRRAAELLEAVPRIPDIGNDDDAGKVGDFVKQIAACVKTLEAARVGEKEPFLAAGREVDGVFNGLKERLEKGKTEISRKLTAYLNEKARIEREAREAEERRRADEARRAEEERRKAEQARREAEERARRAEEEARQAKENAEREAKEREERHARELAAAEARARDEESKRRRSDENRAKAQQEAERLRREAAERIERERAEAEARAKRDAEEAERRAEAAREEARQAEAAAADERRRAEEAEAARIKAEREALAKPADMSRTRSDVGSVSTLRRTWEYAIVDRDALDLNQLRTYFAAEAIDKAIRAAIRNGIRPDAEGNQPLAGIRIYSSNEATVR